MAGLTRLANTGTLGRGHPSERECAGFGLSRAHVVEGSTPPEVRVREKRLVPETCQELSPAAQHSPGGFPVPPRQLPSSPVPYERRRYAFTPPPCESCGSTNTEITTRTDYVLYIRCWASRACGRGESVLPARAVMGALPAHRARDGRRRYRIAGRHLRRVLIDDAGRATWVQSADADLTHLEDGVHADLHSGGQLGAADRMHPHRVCVPQLDAHPCEVPPRGHGGWPTLRNTSHTTGYPASASGGDTSFSLSPERARGFHRRRPRCRQARGQSGGRDHQARHDRQRPFS